LTGVSEVLIASIIRAMTHDLERRVITLMMEEVSACETSVNFYDTTRRNNPKDSHLHTPRCKNLKSHS
jgi:hypothetical protein